MEQICGKELSDYKKILNLIYVGKVIFKGENYLQGVEVDVAHMRD